MRHRAGRILFTVLAAISLLLCVATCALWVRSHGGDEEISRNWHTPTARRAWRVRSHYCALQLSAGSQAEIGPAIAARYAYRDFIRDLRDTHSAFRPPTPDWFLFPPASWHHPAKPGLEERDVFIAYWLLLLLTLVLPSIALVQHRRRSRRNRRQRNNLCPSCGYDLRATPERCPECGTAVAAT